MKSSSVIGMLAAASFAVMASSAQAAWYITDLSVPGITLGQAYDINDNGQIVGRADLSNNSGVMTPFLYDNGTLSILDQTNTYGMATSINNSGQIVGMTSQFSGYLYSNGSFTSLPGIPNSINNSGQVVGSSGVSPYLYQNGSTQNIEGMSGAFRGIASSINDNGLVVGYSEMQGGGTFSFTYNNGQVTNIGQLNGGDTYAKAVNSSGQIVGYSFSNTQDRTALAFLYENGKMTDLGGNFSLGSYAQDINDKGQIIGQNVIPGNQGTSWLYEAGSFINLGALPEVLSAGWRNLQAMAINNKGDIVGMGITDSGMRAFVLSPNQEFAAPTLGGISYTAPEIDGSNAMLGIALLGIALAFMKSKKSA